MGDLSLKPCPFCGTEAVFGEIGDEDSPDFGAHFIQCTNGACGSSSNLQWGDKTDPRPLLAERWNQRAALDLMPSRKGMERRERRMGKRLSERQIEYLQLAAQPKRPLFNAGWPIEAGTMAGYWKTAESLVERGFIERIADDGTAITGFHRTYYHIITEAGREALDAKPEGEG